MLRLRYSSRRWARSVMTSSTGNPSVITANSRRNCEKTYRSSRRTILSVGRPASVRQRVDEVVDPELIGFVRGNRVKPLIREFDQFSDVGVVVDDRDQAFLRIVVLKEAHVFGRATPHLARDLVQIDVEEAVEDRVVVV